MPIPTMQDINNDARLLRISLDSQVERLSDWMDFDDAEKQVRPLYDAVTRLHELAASAVRANDAAGIGR